MPVPTADLDAQLQLTDGRLQLRPWQARDAEPLREAARESLASVGRWLPWCHAGYDLADAQAWIAHCRESLARGEQYALPVLDHADGRLLGGVGLNQLDPQHRSANLGYWVRQSRQGEGIAAAAARLLARYGFERLELARIEILAHPQNQASRRTAEKIGARFQAVGRRQLPALGGAVEMAVYVLTRTDR